MTRNNKVKYFQYPHKYNFGSFLNNIAGNVTDGKFTTGLYKGMDAQAGAALNAGIGIVGGLAGSAIGGGYQTGVGNMMSGLSSVASAIPGPWGAIAGAGLNVLGGLTNRAFGMKANAEAAKRVNTSTNYLNTFTSNASSFDDIVGPNAVSMDTNVYSGGWFKKDKARRKNQELAMQMQEASDKAQRAVTNNAMFLSNQQLSNLEGNYAAFGGPLDFGYPMVGGAIDYEIAQRRLAQQDLLAEAKKALGGPLHSHGADWSNGITIIDNGGTHESNPFEGVPMGVAPDGQPNLVEEGEVIYNDYVYSNRIKVPKSVRDKYKLKGKDDMTFADAAKKAQKESEERPNDPISKRGLNDIMGKLMTEQESIREKREARKQSKFAKGGMLGRLFYGPGDEPNLLLRDPNDTFYVTDFQGTPKVAETPQQIQARVWNENHPETTGIPTPTRQTRTDLLKSTTGESTTGGATKVKTSPLSALRFVPAIGGAIGVFSDLMGWTNKPDYSDANLIMDAASQAKNVEFSPIGNYLRYTPLDRLFYANQLGAQAGATRRNIMNTSGGNRGAAMAGLLAADFNAQTQLGKLYRQAEEYNLAQRERVEAFNRDTNKFNSEGFLKAQLANKENDKLRLDAAVKAAAIRDSVDARVGAARSANLTNLFDSLGDIGREQFSMDMIKNNPALLYDWMGRYKGAPKARGGFLTIKKRRR